MLTTLGRRARGWVEATQPWTNVYGLARTLLALGTAGTLLFSHSTSLFRPAAGIPEVPICSGLQRLSLFCWVPRGHLEAGRWIAVALLLVVASGWRPRWTALIHWWVTLSLSICALLVDGGDQMATVLTLLLLPLALTDPRPWHWSPAPARAPTRQDELARLVALSAHLMVRVQMAGTYFHASLGKLKSDEWADGTALYYWFTQESLGVPRWFQHVMSPLLTSRWVALLTWGVLVFEFLLFMSLTWGRGSKRVLLSLAVAFHVSIAITYGLTSFLASMSAGLILLLRPLDEPFNFQRESNWREADPTLEMKGGAA